MHASEFNAIGSCASFGIFPMSQHACLCLHWMHSTFQASSEQHCAESTVLRHSHKVLLNMQVRVDAVVALRSFIDAFDTEGLQQVKPLIPQLLDVFFQLMQEVGLPTLTLLTWLWLGHAHAGGRPPNIDSACVAVAWARPCRLVCIFCVTGSLCFKSVMYANVVLPPSTPLTFSILEYGVWAAFLLNRGWSLGFIASAQQTLSLLTTPQGFCCSVCCLVLRVQKHGNGSCRCLTHQACPPSDLSYLPAALAEALVADTSSWLPWLISCHGR